MAIVKQLLKYYLYMISIFFIGRLGLFLLYFDNFKDSGVDYWLTFIYGLRMDTISTSMLLAVPLIAMTLSPNKLKNFVSKFLKYYFVVVLGILIYMENATFPFVAEYDMRPNYLFVEYLVYPKEIGAMIFARYKLELFISFSMIIGFSIYYLKYAKNSFDDVFELSYPKRLLLFIPILLVLFIGVRSSLGHRPANTSDAMYTSNRMVNEITKNSIYNVGYAIYGNSKHGSKKLMKKYGKMNKQEALARVQKRLNIHGLDEKSPFSRLEKSNFKTTSPKNLVIFIQESLGYQFVEAVGGEKGITPNLNRLSKEGVLFKDLYSNGTRSIRGLAGISAGNFAIPGKGVLKRNKSQSDFYTLASSLNPLGYHTTFMYGGESRFDNMKSWFVGNGFQEIIDQTRFKNPTFVAPWGVCDGDLVVRANEEFKKMYANGQKFATVMFSQSNHSPFEYPDGKITLIDGEDKQTVKNAVKYADYAIGQLFELAKKEAYYKDTIFVVVADHNTRVYGPDMLPVDMFHIPALIIGEGVEPMVYDKLATQPDVLATTLDLLGVDLKYPILGHSIFSDKKQNIAFMQFHTSYALRVDDKVAVIRPNKKAVTFSYKDPTNFNHDTNNLIEVEHDEELEKDALAFVITLDHMYNKKLYN